MADQEPPRESATIRLPLLQQSRPAFLDLLDADPVEAQRELHAWVTTFFALCPPREHRLLPPGARDDAVHEVFVACVERNFHRLRMYRDTGRPFAAWFNRLAGNRIHDWWNAQCSAWPAERMDPAGEGRADDRAGPAELFADRELVRAAARALARLDDLCRLLVVAAAEGRSPRELTLLLGWDRDRNKEVSDRLRHCRNVLARFLRDAGMDVGSRFGRGGG